MEHQLQAHLEPLETQPEQLAQQAPMHQQSADEQLTTDAGNSTQQQMA